MHRCGHLPKAGLDIARLGTNLRSCTLRVVGRLRAGLASRKLEAVEVRHGVSGGAAAAQHVEA